MYSLHLTDQLADAALRYHKLLEADPEGPSSLVIVQSAHMQRWLSRTLATAKGIWFQPQFATPDGGLRSILRDMAKPDGSPKRTSLFMDDLKYLSFRSLNRLTEQADFADSYPLLDTLLRGNQSAKAIPRQSLYQLADAVSGLFYNYSQLLWSLEPGREADTHLFDLWQQGRCLLDKGRAGSAKGGSETEMADHEAWQRQLFCAMFPPERPYDISGYQVHRANAEQWAYQGKYQRLVLFGSAFLSSQVFAFYRGLAERGMEIHHILLTPSPALATGAGPEKGLLKDWGGLIEPFFGSVADAGIQPDTMFSPADLPSRANGELNPLALLRLGLGQSDDQSLSAAIGPTVQDHDAPSMWPRPGFRCFSCTTPWREVESLKQNLLALMTELRESGNPLLAQEIAVMAPDIRKYRPFLESIFPSRAADGSLKADHLPLNLVDLDFGGESAVVSALNSLLDLAGSRLERSWILEMLDNPAIQLAIGIESSDVAMFREWSSAYFVQWGLNAKHRENLETGSSWSNTLDRGLQSLFNDLAAGTIQVANSELQAIGRIAEYLHRNVLLLTQWSSSRKSLQDWVRELQELMDRSIQAPDPAEGRILDQVRSAAGNILNFAADLGNPAIVSDEIDWIGFHILFQDQIAHLSSSRGQHQIDGITCSSLRPYRAIPFRLIALLGMNEGELPRPDEQFSFDLSRLEKRSQGLISRRLTDNYAWLETIGSAREWLWVYYQGRDPTGPESLQPASMVSETLDYFYRLGFSPDNLIVQEPILNFAPDYFLQSAGARGLRNLDPAVLGLAQSWLAAPEYIPDAGKPQQNTFTLESTLRDKDFLRGKAGDGLHINCKDLLDMLINPPRSYVRKRLGIYLDSTDAESLSDQETLDPPFWLSNQILKAVAGTIATEQLDKLSQDTLLDLTGSGEVFPSPFASLALEKMATSLERVQAPLATLADSPGHLETLEIELDKSFKIHLSPDQAGLAAGDYPVRLGGALKNLWRINGELAYVIIGSGAYSSASSISDRKYLELAVTLTICRSLGMEIPTKLMHISTNAKTKEAKILDTWAIPSLDDDFLELNQLIQAWLVNLIKPLPFYQSVITALCKNGSTSPEWPQLWPSAWQQLSIYNGETFPPFSNPRICPYFRFIGGDENAIPPWQEGYSPWIELVWRPANLVRFFFVRGKNSKKGLES